MKQIHKIVEGFPFRHAMVTFGNLVYFYLHNGNRVKVQCVSSGLVVEAINPIHGKIDALELPFSSYMAPRKTSPDSAPFTPFIQNGTWLMEQSYPDLLPTRAEFNAICRDVQNYCDLFGEPKC